MDAKLILIFFYYLAPGHPPADLSVFNTSSTSIKVEWSPVPADFRRGIILGYRVFLTRSAQNGRGRPKRDLLPNGNVICSETTNLTTEFQGLEMYSNYCVEAVAYNRVGESGRTNVTCTLTDEAGILKYIFIPLKHLIAGLEVKRICNRIKFWQFSF